MIILVPFVCVVDRDGNRIEGPATHFLEGDLPSNHLQSHHHAHSLSNTIYPSKCYNYVKELQN